MVALIEQVRKDGNSIGGLAEFVASGVPAGLGEPVFDKLKADLAKGLFSLPAVLGVEYGVGFGCTLLRGTENNDVFYSDRAGRRAARGDPHEPPRRYAGAAFPPACRSCSGPRSSRPAACRSNRRPSPRGGEPTTISTKGRHDPCLLPRFIPMGEAMIALVLADHWLRQPGARNCSVSEIWRECQRRDAVLVRRGIGRLASLETRASVAARYTAGTTVGRRERLRVAAPLGRPALPIRVSKRPKSPANRRARKTSCRGSPAVSSGPHRQTYRLQGGAVEACLCVQGSCSSPGSTTTRQTAPELAAQDERDGVRRRRVHGLHGPLEDLVEQLQRKLAGRRQRQQWSFRPERRVERERPAGQMLGAHLR